VGTRTSLGLSALRPLLFLLWWRLDGAGPCDIGFSSGGNTLFLRTPPGGDATLLLLLGEGTEIPLRLNVLGLLLRRGLNQVLSLLGYISSCIGAPGCSSSLLLGAPPGGGPARLLLVCQGAATPLGLTLPALAL
jgi:hypothetical protein